MLGAYVNFAWFLATRIPRDSKQSMHQKFFVVYTNIIVNFYQRAFKVRRKITDMAIEEIKVFLHTVAFRNLTLIGGSSRCNSNNNHVYIINDNDSAISRAS